MTPAPSDDPRKAGTIWALDLDEDAPFVFPQVIADFERLGPEDAEELAAVMDGVTKLDILARFATGKRCYGIRVREKLAAYGWVSFDEEFVGELRLRVRLVPGEAYIWDCATVPEFRRHRLYTALLSYILSDLRFDHLKRAWIGANLDNEPSQRGIARAGFHHVANLVVERVLGTRMVWVEGWPGAPESLVEKARRVFLGDRDKVWQEAVTRAVK